MLLAACTGTSGPPRPAASTTGPEPTPSPATSPFAGGETAVVSIAGEVLTVAVADSGDERARGLMDVDDLGGLDGMLFVFEEPRPVNFVMKNTRIPLDIWFISEDGEIIGTAEMEPCPTEPCPRYRSPDKIDRALETPLGEYDFAVGDVFSTVGSD